MPRGKPDVVSEVSDEDLTYRRRLLWVILLSVMGFGSLMTLVTVALPTISDDLDASVVTLLWTVTGLMLAMAVMTPLMGKIGDVHGHRRVLLIGLASSTVLTFLCGMAWDQWSLIVFRVLFGIAGAAVMPSSMALMMHAYPISQRATAMGWFQFAMTGAPTIGLVIGGPLIEAFNWRPMFFLFGIVTALALFAGWRIVRDTPHQPAVQLDWAGAATLAAITLAVLLSIVRMAARSRDGAPILADPVLWALVATAVGSFLLFVRIERRVANPLLRLSLFSNRNFTSPLVASAANQCAYMGAFVLTPLLLHSQYGYQVGATALILAPRPGAFSISAPLGGKLTGAVGEKLPMLLGSVLMITAMGTFALGSFGDGLWWIIAGLVLSGISAGIASPAYQTLVASAVEPKDLGVANGMSQTMLWVGIILGIQSMGAIAGESATGGRFATTFMIGAVIAGFGLLAALAARPGRPGMRPPVTPRVVRAATTGTPAARG